MRPSEEEKDLIAYLKRVPEENGFMIDGDCVRREAQIGSNCDEEESEKEINRRSESAKRREIRI